MALAIILILLTLYFLDEVLSLLLVGVLIMLPVFVLVGIAALGVHLLGG